MAWKSLRTSKNERGQAMVEFALVAGLFFFLVFSAIQFVFAYYQKHALYLAAKEGMEIIVKTAESDPAVVRAAVVSKVQEILQKHGIKKSTGEVEKELTILPNGNFLEPGNDTPVIIKLSNNLWIPITLKTNAKGDGPFSISASVSEYRNYFGA